MNITFMNRFLNVLKWNDQSLEVRQPGIKRYPRGAPKEIHILSKVVINETFPVDDK